VTSNSSDACQDADRATLIGRFYEFLRAFSSSAYDSQDKISYLKSQLAELQNDMARCRSIPEHWLRLTWRELFERQNWGGQHPEGLDLLLEEVRVAWLRAQSQSLRAEED
jgi:hypothetical protein